MNIIWGIGEMAFQRIMIPINLDLTFYSLFLIEVSDRIVRPYKNFLIKIYQFDKQANFLRKREKKWKSIFLMRTSQTET